jgi:hypothetical protein
VATLITPELSSCPLMLSEPASTFTVPELFRLAVERVKLPVPPALVSVPEFWSVGGLPPLPTSEKSPFNVRLPLLINSTPPAVEMPAPLHVAVPWLMSVRPGATQ